MTIRRLAPGAHKEDADVLLPHTLTPIPERTACSGLMEPSYRRKRLGPDGSRTALLPNGQ
jgi:hypothetical protein